MLLAAALASIQPGVPTPGFDEALARSKRYEKQYDDFRMVKFYAVVGQAMANFGKDCVGDDPIETERAFTLVVSYRDGRFDKVETDNTDPAAACFQEKLSQLSYPAPPVPDFAEEIHMRLMPGDGPEPGQAPPPEKPGKH